MIANLMMYERPELQGAHARFWDLVRSALADNGIAAPETLSQDADANSVWTDPEMVLSQTCGMPYRLWLHGKVQLIGTPRLCSARVSCGLLSQRLCGACR